MRCILSLPKTNKILNPRKRTIIYSGEDVPPAKPSISVGSEEVAHRGGRDDVGGAGEAARYARKDLIINVCQTELIKIIVKGREHARRTRVWQDWRRGGGS